MLPIDKYDIVIDDSDRELFIIFKSIADAGLPYLDELQTSIVRKTLWAKKRRLRFKIHDAKGIIKIDFPRITPIAYIISFIKYLIELIKKDDKDEDDDTNLRQVV